MNTAQKILKGLAHDYRLAENPLYCWEAWRISRESGEPLPDFAAAYFDRVAARFVTMENPETKTHDATVVEAAEFRTPGRGNRWTQAQSMGVWDSRHADRVRIFSEVQAEHALGTPIDRAFEAVAIRLRISESKARDCFYDMKKRWPQPRPSKSSG